MMVRTFLLLWLVVQLSCRGMEGDHNYQVLVTVHSLVLLESRCAECYGKAGEPVQRDSCCDGGNMTSCPASCDILLRFCPLGDLLQFNLANRLLGARCAQTPLSSHLEEWLGSNFMTDVVYPEFDGGSLLNGRATIFQTPVTYDEAGEWKGAELNISVVDRDIDPGEFEDLIDYFIIPINISAGSSMTSNFTGIYNYVQLELTIKVRCTARNNSDERCGCLPGFTGKLCEDINDCIGVTCSDRGRCMDEDNGYRCACIPGFSGPLCEENIDDCVGVKCNNRGRCVDGIQNFSCICDPGYTGATCESEMASITSTTSSSAPAVPVAAVAGGVVGGVLFLLMLVVLILILALLVFRQRRTKIFDVQGSSKTGFDSSKVVLQSGDVHMYDEAAGNGARKTGTSGSETLKEFKNPIYGDDPELEHEYETTDKAYSGSKDHSDQYQELERKFENPIYGDEDDGNSSNPIPPHESNIDYDQVGNVYHTLESEQDRQQRYAEAGKAAATAIAASVEVKDSSKGQTGKPQHSYEDVQ